MTKSADSETIESILAELFDVLGGSHERLRKMGIGMPAIYFKAAAQIVGQADMETRHIAERLVEELHRQGVIASDAPPGRGQA